MDQAQTKYWLALNTISGLGITGQRALMQAFKSPEQIFAASIAHMSAVEGIGKTLAGRIHHFKDWQRIEGDLARYQLEQITIIPWHDQSYPELLSHIYDPPALLFVRGTLSDDVPCIAVVGSRIASSYGILVTEKICRELAYKGIAVVSGMARGIDTAAHRGALSGRGKTVAVLGSGLDVVYPQENLKLSETIAGNGALVTEYP
jgi:DNA processing protein